MPDEQSQDIGRLEGLIVGVKETLDKIDEKLDKINGRVRQNECDIAKTKGVASTLGATIGFVAGILGAIIKGAFGK
jgi:tetrahydromethanopterin S-methyltransferase subunit G